MATGSLTTGNSASQDAARRAAEEAARRAAEEAARKAAQEAARKAAEEAARRAAEAGAQRARTDQLGVGATPVEATSAYSQLTKTGTGTLQAAASNVDPKQFDQPTVDRFFAEHAEAVAKLSPPEQAGLRDLVGTLTGNRVSGELADRNFRDLGTMLENGVLMAKGSDGATTLSHLTKHLGQPLHASIEGRFQREHAMSDLVATLANPGGIYQGSGTQTCTAAVVETLMARSSPADFARFATGLLYDGAGVTPSGASVGIHGDELFLAEMGKNTGRGPFNAVIQGSLMAYARNLNPEDGTGIGGGRGGGTSTYGAGRATSSRGTYGGNKSTDDGLTSEQLAGMVRSVFGGSQQAVEVGEANRGMAMDQVLSALGTKGGRSGVPVGIRTSQGTLHEVLVIENRGGKVVFKDPGDASVKEMDRAEFEAAISSVIVPNPPSRFGRKEDLTRF